MKVILIAFAVLVFTNSRSVAQWQFAGAGDMTGQGGGSDFALGVHDSTLFRSDENGVWRYDPHGLHPWGRVNNGIDFSQGTIKYFASLGRFFFAGMSRQGGPAAGFSTTNNGDSWTLNAGGALCSNGSYLFAVGGDGSYRSKDSGQNWEKVASFITTSYGASGRCILASGSSGFWRSVDTGTSWSKTIPPSGLSLFGFGVIGTQFFAGGKGVFRSTDSGQSWTSIGLTNRTVSELTAYRTYLFAGTDSGVFVSLDTGMHWRNVSEGLTTRSGHPLDARHLAILDTTLFVDVYTGSDFGFTYGYVAKRPISEMIDSTQSAVAEGPSISLDSILVYPNPLSNRVTIASGGASLMQVNVLNVLGVDLMDIPSGRESEVTLDLSHLSKGTYFLRVLTEKGYTLRKIVKE